ncbi:MAG: hypothetical protein AAB673_01385 [Patescibacteria group bacterium]
MPIDKRVLNKALEIGAVRGGKMIGALKQKVVTSAKTMEQGRKDYKTVERTLIKPATGNVTIDRFGKVFNILKEAGVLKASVSGPRTLLQKATANIAKVRAAEDLAKNKKGQEKTKKGRLEEESVTGIGCRNLLEKIETEENTSKTAEGVLKDVKGAKDTGHSVSVFENVSQSKERPPAEPVINQSPTPPMDF